MTHSRKNTMANYMLINWLKNEAKDGSVMLITGIDRDISITVKITNKDPNVYRGRKTTDSWISDLFLKDE